ITSSSANPKSNSARFRCCDMSRGRCMAPFAIFRPAYSVRAAKKVAGRERLHEEATRTAPEPAEPHGPRRCGGPEHSVGLSIRSDVSAPRPARLVRTRMVANRLAERARPNQLFNLLIGSAFHRQPKALWLTAQPSQPH